MKDSVPQAVPPKLVKEVYASGLPSQKDDTVVIKDYTFVWDDNAQGRLQKLVVNYRHFQDAEMLRLFFKKENELLLTNPRHQLPSVRKMLVNRDWAVAEAKEAFLEGFGVYDLLTCITGKTSPMLRRQNTEEITRKRKLHERSRIMAYDTAANCSNFVVIPGQESMGGSPGFDGDLYAVFDLFALDDRIPLSINRPIGQRMMTLDSRGYASHQRDLPPVNHKSPMTFAEELTVSKPFIRDILRQTKSFWIPYSQSPDDTLPRTLVFFTPDLERSWQVFDFSTDDEVQNFTGIKNKQEAFDFVSGQVLFRFFSSDLASKWSEVIAACSEHVLSVKGSIMAETSTELAQKIWEGEVFWKYLGQTIDKQIEVLLMFCSELKSSPSRKFPIINLEDEDMEWIQIQMLKLKRLITQNLIEPTNTNMQMLYTIASLREAQTANEYGASMNRLSWVTVIFLPPMFVTGVLGVDYDTIKQNSLVKWCLIGSVLLLGLAAVSWGIYQRLPPFKRKPKEQRFAY